MRLTDRNPKPKPTLTIGLRNPFVEGTEESRREARDVAMRARRAHSR
jgi:hypothetical protein